MKKRIFSLLMVIAIIVGILPATIFNIDVYALFTTTDKDGIWFIWDGTTGDASYAVCVTDSDDLYIDFYVQFVGENGSPIYTTESIHVQQQYENTTKYANFTWRDSWDNEGTGTILWANRGDKILLSLVQTKTAVGNRSTLTTNGERVLTKVGTELTEFNSVVSTWAKEEVEEAYNYGLVPYVLVGEDLTKKVDRAEFAAIAVSLYKKLSNKTPEIAENPFIDISQNICKDDILKVYNLNITNGITDNTFEPESLITREEAATMLTRAYKKSEWKDWTLSKDGQYALNSMGVNKFADDSEISDWAKESVYFMVKWNIINGFDNNMFGPKGNTSIGESYGYATCEQAIAIALRSVKYLYNTPSPSSAGGTSSSSPSAAQCAE